EMIISEQDRDFIFHPKRKDIAVIPNGVDQEFFRPVERQKKYEIVFTGNMNYPPNVDSAVLLARDILPLVKRKVPEAKLLIAGAQPANAVKALASSDVIVSGWMDDIRDAYSESKVFIAPMQIGSGLQNKLLEAMSMGLPCITSALANNALGAEPGKEILVGNNPQEYANHILELLNNQELASDLSDNGLQFIRRKYSWESSAQLLEDLMTSA
ncbi:MAG: glycosyltransferase, partial [Bacteroidota bacterium]